MNAPFGTIPYSAEVKLWLETERGQISLSQTASKFVIARKPINLPPCRAELIVSVDGRLHKRPVLLVNGMSETDEETLIADAAA